MMPQRLLSIPAFNVPASCECCHNCAHYYQHYGRYIPPDETGCHYFYMLNDGHCAYPRMKNRRPDDICEHFTLRNR